MGTESINPEDVFHKAIKISGKEQRATYLDEVCKGNKKLRTEIEELLKAHEEADSFLEVPDSDPDITLDESPLVEKSGTVIGRYKLLEKIGEGGFGVVYMAEQTKPISRRVALKIIKLGMDTKQVIARFEAERQALAMMDHPNIAKVLDAGATDTGRPYFVMELVKGIPITEYCDKNNLDTKQRLELFVDVCKAVQHAHQKGIIHRDLKPSNVLITLHDGKPVPKIIDFGIAKATAQRLTEKTVFTRFAQMIGTPEYMSPEQAEFSGLDVDARSDIYSLGVLLYQLLTGVTPFDAEKLREAGYGEMQRIIREDEPDKPSTRLNAIGEALTDVAKHRKVSPDLLQKLLRGDLDLIVMKTLEKDRTRRYERAVELAADVERHLNNKPVLAAPPSITYRMQKFVRRNRVAVITVFLVAAALIIGVVSTSVTFLSSESLTGTVEQPMPNYRLVLDDNIAGMPVGGCDLSPNGERIVFNHDKNIYVADQAVTEIRPLLDDDDLGSWEFMSSPRWSPDGKLIAYSLSREAPPDSNAMIISAVFVLNPDSGAPRQIGPDITIPYFIRIFWTPDGHINFRSGDIVCTLTLDGREVRSFTSKELPFVNPLDGRSYSPNGRWIVFDREKEDESGSELCIFPTTGGTWRRLTDLPGYHHWPAWAPDGRTLYLVSESNIWKLPMDQENGLANGEPQQVSFFKDAFIESLKVLGDGSRIAFSMSKMNTYLKVADASSPQKARSLVQCGFCMPELSPDGQTVYYMNDTPGEEGIYAITQDGSASRLLTESLPLGDITGFVPTFDLSPDGRTLAYSAKLGDEYAIFTLPVNGGEPQPMVRLAQKRGSNTVPQWSPDGSQLAYIDSNDLNVIPADGGQPRQLANINPGYWGPDSIRWSPDGKFIAASGILNLEKSNAVFVVPASGGELQQITPDDFVKQGLEWHPDGQRLTYTVFRPDGATYQAYPDSREPALLVDAPDISDWIGTWAPDGRRYFFLGFAAGGTGFYVYDESSDKTTFVSDSADSTGLPGFSRNGTTMAWWACRMSSNQTWIMEDFLPKSTADK